MLPVDDLARLSKFVLKQIKVGYIDTIPLACYIEYTVDVASYTETMTLSFPQNNNQFSIYSCSYAAVAGIDEPRSV